MVKKHDMCLIFGILRLVRFEGLLILKWLGFGVHASTPVNNLSARARNFADILLFWQNPFTIFTPNRNQKNIGKLEYNIINLSVILKVGSEYA